LPENSNHKQYDVPNWNGLIGVYPGTIGMKIGNTGDAGHTAIVVSKRDGHKMLAVVLGATDLFGRDLSAANLLDMGYEKELGLPRINVTRQQLQEKYNSWYE
jgi:D-alanyl-D-alanine carboxypeptidase